MLNYYYFKINNFKIKNQYNNYNICKNNIQRLYMNKNK